MLQRWTDHEGKEYRVLEDYERNRRLIDLSHHDQDWVRDACGDLWLGFENHELDQWAAQAGLISAQSMYLGLRNGFQVQLRVFKKPAVNGQITQQNF